MLTPRIRPPPIVVRCPWKAPGMLGADDETVAGDDAQRFAQTQLNEMRAAGVQRFVIEHGDLRHRLGRADVQMDFLVVFQRFGDEIQQAQFRLDHRDGSERRAAAQHRAALQQLGRDIDEVEGDALAGAALSRVSSP